MAIDPDRGARAQAIACGSMPRYTGEARPVTMDRWGRRWSIVLIDNLDLTVVDLGRSWTARGALWWAQAHARQRSYPVRPNPLGGPR